MKEQVLCSLDYSQTIKNIVFLGETVGQSDLISYEDLRTAVGFTQGTKFASNGTDVWLKFKFDSTITYIAKTLVNRSVSWNYINSIGCVYGENQINIGGLKYKVRLIRGANYDPIFFDRAYASENTFESEWDRVFYPLIKDSSSIPVQFQVPNAQYNQNDFMGMSGAVYETLCMETSSQNSSNCMYRGYLDVTYAVCDIPKSRKGSYDCWRPLLELIS